MFSILLGYFAGIVSILSPCVLPILPIVLMGSLQADKNGPLFLTAGLVSSFAFFGIFIATSGVSLGLDRVLLQQISAILILIFGIIMMSKTLYARFATVASGATDGLNNKINSIEFNGKKGQFVLGVLLGAVWTPCVGPTLGAALSLAAQGQQVLLASWVMFAFALGIGTPVLLMGRLSQSTMLKFKNKLMQNSNKFKFILGLIFVILAILILTGWLLEIEEFLLEHVFPEALIDFIYKF